MFALSILVREVRDLLGTAQWLAQVSSEKLESRRKELYGIMTNYNSNEVTLHNPLGRRDHLRIAQSTLHGEHDDLWITVTTHAIPTVVGYLSAGRSHVKTPPSSGM